MLRIVRLILLLVIGILGATFAALNTGQVEISYYLGSWRASLALALAFALVLGILIGIVSCTGIMFRSRRERRRLIKALKRCEQDLSSLRNTSSRNAH